MIGSNNRLYKTVTIKSWKELQHYSEYRSRTTSDRNKWSRWIFRGHKRANWRLSTTLERTFRDRFDKDLSAAGEWERRLTREFMRKAEGLLTNPPRATDYMEWLALMQHYGAPTRLLDWTYSFWVAVLFAIQDLEIEKKSSCAVWALDIDWWRDMCVVKKVPELGAMLKKGSNLNPEINFVLNSQGKPGVPCGIWPLNAYRLNERVVAQQALFVAPLDVTKTFMDNLRDCSQDQQNIFEHMIKFVITCSKDIVPKAIKYLYGHNMTSATFSPGIDGFARSIANMVLLPDRFRGIGDDPYRDWPN
jgi:hypothetical protein